MRLVAGLLFASGALAAAAAEPACTVAWDQAGLRQALATTAPTSLWYAPAATEVRQRLQRLGEDARRRRPELPDLAQLWRRAGTGALSADAGMLAVRLDAGDAVADALAAAQRWVDGHGGTVQQEGTVVCWSKAARAARALPERGEDLLRLTCALGPLLASTPGLAWLRRPGGGPAQLEAGIGVREGAWQGRLQLRGGAGPRLLPLDQAFAARVPERPLSVVLAIEPAAVVELLQGVEGDRLAYLTATLGIAPAQAVVGFTGELALTMTGDRPMPKVLLLARLAPTGDARGLIAHLGDAFGGKPMDLAGANRAWTVPSPGGPLRLALAEDLLLVGNDDEGMDAVLAKAAGPLQVDGEALIACADQATVGGWLALARMVMSPVTLVDDPLPGQLATLRESGWALIQAGHSGQPAETLRGGVARTLRLPGGVQRTFTSDPGLPDRLRALFGRDPAEVLASSAALHGDAAQAVLVLRTGNDAWLVADSAAPPRVRSRETVEPLLAGLPLVWGHPLLDQSVAELPAPVVWDQRCVPVVTIDHLPSYRAGISAIEGGWRLTEQGLPLVTGAVAVGAARWWLAESARPAPAAAVDQ
jgi:hypothetical protein